MPMASFGNQYRKLWQAGRQAGRRAGGKGSGSNLLRCWSGTTSTDERWKEKLRLLRLWL